MICRRRVKFISSYWSFIFLNFFMNSRSTNRYKHPSTNTRFSVSIFFFPAVNFVLHRSRDDRLRITRRGRLYSLYWTRNSIIGVSIYFNYPDMFPLARVPLRLWLVFSAFWWLARPPPGSGVSFRFNWTSRIVPLPRSIGLCACVPRLVAHIVRYVSAYVCALHGCFRCSRCTCASMYSRFQ